MDYTSYKGRGKDKISGEYRPIRYLPNVSEWVGKIYMLEDESDQYSADDVLGGVGGIDNAQPQALANRTYYLKDTLVKIGEVISAMQLALAPMLTTIKKLVIQKNTVTDWEHDAWLTMKSSTEADQFYERIKGSVPRIILTFDNGYVQNPIFRVTLENSKVFFIRTDGVTVLVPRVEDFLDFGDDE